ncbi:MAG: hypothetical protein V3S70_07365 [Gammaproteobacteria bacterium]
MGSVCSQRFPVNATLIPGFVACLAIAGAVRGQEDEPVPPERLLQPVDTQELLVEGETLVDADTELLEPRAAVVISGVAEMRFNPRIGTLFFRILGAELSEDATDAVVYINGRQVSSRELAVASNVIAVNYVFVGGLNEIQLRSLDKRGQPVEADSLLWAGSHLFVVDVVDRNQNPVDGALVSVELADDRSVKATAETIYGSAVFRNLPPAMVVVRAESPTGRRTRETVPGDSGSVLLQLR